jgi:hypothetical protein
MTQESQTQLNAPDVPAYVIVGCFLVHSSSRGKSPTLIPFGEY